MRPEAQRRPSSRRICQTVAAGSIAYPIRQPHPASTTSCRMRTCAPHYLIGPARERSVIPT
jgi:hypothetical protein